MTDYFQNKTTEKDRIILNLENIKAPQSPIKKVYFKDVITDSHNLSKENKKNNDSNNSNSTNNNTLLISGNLSKISPLPKPDFSSITRFENSLSYKEKGSHKKIKLTVPNSPIKTPNKYSFTPNDIKYSKDLKPQRSACRKLNFFEADDSKDEQIINNNCFKSMTEKKEYPREINVPISFNQSSIPNIKNSDFLIKTEITNGSFNLNGITPFSANSIQKEKIIQTNCNSNLDLNLIKNNYYQISNYSNKDDEYKTLSTDLFHLNKISEFKLNKSNDNSFSNRSNYNSPSPNKYYQNNEHINNMNKYKRKRTSNQTQTNSIQDEKKQFKFRMDNVQISKFEIDEEEIEDDFTRNLNKKLSLNEIPNSPNFFPNSAIPNLNNILPQLGNKKNMLNFWNELSENTSNKISFRDFVNTKEFKLEDKEDNTKNFNDEIKKNLFNEFDQKDKLKLSLPFSLENDNEKIDEEERLKKEEYYNKLVNQINLFKNYNSSEKPEFKDNTKMDIDIENENLNDSFLKSKEESKIWIFVIFYFILIYFNLF
jgi:hypothetical protein